MNYEKISLLPISYATSRMTRPRSLPRLMMFLAFLSWYFGARVLAGSAANGLAFRFRLVAGRTLLEACFQLFLLVIGYAVLQRIAREIAPLTELMALPRRATARREWLTGAALGWGMVVAGILPLVLMRGVRTHISFGREQVEMAGLALAVLGVTALTHEMAFRGYPFRCLIDAVGPSLALTLMVAGAGLSAWHNAWIPGMGVIASMLLTLLLSITWLRTRAVWLAWGLHFSLVASGSVLFGLPVGGGERFSLMVRTWVYGPDWLTGGDFGPAAGLLSVIVLVGAVVVVYRVTREYAWNYTHAPIVAGGYEVNVAPPAAHTAMEQKAAQAPALVQILATTPTSFSAETPSLRDRIP